MVNIALVGYSRSGKDTVGEMIQDYLELNGHGYTRQLAFGDDMKERFHWLFPHIPEEPKPRKEYEAFGKYTRSVDENIWVNGVAVEFGGWKGLYQNFVITDLRQPNEAEWCRKNGFIIVEVYSPDFYREGRSKGDSTFVPINESEERIHEINCDYKILNNKTFEYLEGEVKDLMDSIMKKEAISIEKPTH